MQHLSGDAKFQRMLSAVRQPGSVSYRETLKNVRGTRFALRCLIPLLLAMLFGSTDISLSLSLSLSRPAPVLHNQSVALAEIVRQQRTMKKAFGETQTLHAGCSKTEPKIFAPPQTPLPGGAGRPKFNQLEMVTTYKPSLVRIDLRYFELSW